MFRTPRKKSNAIDDAAARERRGVLAVAGDDGYPYAVRPLTISTMLRLARSICTARSAGTKWMPSAATTRCASPCSATSALTRQKPVPVHVVALFRLRLLERKLSCESPDDEAICPSEFACARLALLCFSVRARCRLLPLLRLGDGQV